MLRVTGGGVAEKAGVDAGRQHLCTLPRLESHSEPYEKLTFPGVSHPESLPLFSGGVEAEGEGGGARGAAPAPPVCGARCHSAPAPGASEARPASCIPRTWQPGPGSSRHRRTGGCWRAGRALGRNAQVAGSSASSGDLGCPPADAPARADMPPSISAFQAAYISIELLIALVSVPGNVLVIWAVKVNQALRDATFCFIVSLAVADVAVGALVIPLAILINVGPQTYFHTCLMVACPVLILTQSSILALLAIAVDRYLRVKTPLRYKAVVTPRRAAVAIAGCWTLAFLVGLTPMFGWNNLSEVRRAWAANGSVGEPVIKCEFEKVISMEYMVYFNFFVWVLPPLLLMVLIYLEVFHLIRKQLAKKVAGSAGDPHKYYGKELRIAKSLALVLVLFALSWLPLHVLNCITLFCPSCHKPSVLIYVAIFLTHGNSAMNPIVYAFRIQKFRVTFLKIWNDHFRCQPAPPTGEDAPEDRPAD